MNCSAEIVQGRPIFKIAVQAIGLFHQDRVTGRAVLHQILQHRRERGSAGSLGRFHVYEFFDDDQAMLDRVIPQRALLSRNGIAFLLLILAGHSRVEHNAVGARRRPVLWGRHYI